MKTKSANPTPATLLKREQRERRSNGVQNAKGRVKQCDLANDALTKSNPKQRLQTLLADNKISVMGLKRCYSDGTIDESVLCLLGIPFRRRSVVTEKTPKTPKKEPPVQQVMVDVTPSDTLPFVERNAIHSQDNVARKTRAEADIANALVKVQHELARQDQLEKNERLESRPVVKPSARTMDEKNERRTESRPPMVRGGRQRTLEDQIKQQKNQSVVQLLNQSGFLVSKIQ